jgi:alginate O-acetyltransferase complex protein AlgJ
MQAARTIRTAGSLATATIFLASLLAPLVGSFVDLDPTPKVDEKRTRATRPVLSLAALEYGLALPATFQSLERWFDDHFGFRDALLRVNSLLRVRLLDSSPTPRVAIGSEGWYYLRGESRSFHRALEPFTPAQLDAWHALLESRRQRLADRGCRYLHVFVPGKSSIHPEHLPPGERRVGEKTRLQQLLAHLADQDSAVDVLDLTPVLAEVATREPAYYRTDTHWNAAGAKAGYLAIATRLAAWFEAVEPPPTIDHLPSIDPPDLALLLGLEHLREEQLVVLFPRPLSAALQPLPISPQLAARIGGRTFAAGTGRSELPKAVIFRDSFTVPLEPVLPELFERAVLLAPREQHVFLDDLIAAEAPDVVIVISCERFLMIDPPQ